MVPPDDSNGNGENSWKVWGKHVILTLESLENDIKEMYIAIAKLDKQIALLTFKVSIYGAIAGAIPSMITAAIIFLKK